MFSDDELDYFRQITLLYAKVKELVIFCEENHDEFKSNLHVVKELRDSFDHLMRIFAIKFDLKENGDEYININMEKIFGHVYRAGYDSLDYASLILRDKINNEVEGFSPSAIQAAIPSYYSEIRPTVEKITDDIVKLRTEKDVANSSLEEFSEYVDNIEKLHEMYDVILKAKPSLIEYTDKQKRDSFWKILIQIGIGIIIGAILIMLKS